jgi:tetratricopeptide (TPR) repeat protein
MTTPEALALAVAYHEQGAWQQTEHLCRQILESEPYHEEALQLLGIVAAQLGKKDLAVECFSRIVALKPNQAQAHFNLGVAFLAQARTREAIASFRQAILHNADFAEAHYNLGITLAELGLTDEAVASYEQVLRLRPDFAEAHNNLGVALAAQGRLDEAVACYRHAVHLNADYADAYTNLAQALRVHGKLEEVVNPLQQVVRLQSNSAGARNDLGLAYAVLGQPEEALAAFESALSLEPDSAPAHVNRGQALLLLGRLSEGWQENEWRIRCDDYPETLLPLPHWDGSDLTGKTIVLYGEQGLGDTLQFIRYAPLVKARGGMVVAACPALLLPILAGCPGVDRLVLKGPGAAEAAYVQALLPSLPAIFKTTLDTIPAEVPYLFADPVRVEFWREKLAQVPGFKVGILWQGSAAHPRDRWRSAPVAEFAPLARVAGVRLLSLQMDQGREQLAALDGLSEVIDLSFQLADNPFAETAAVMKNLDLVVTVDTAAAHLAGALGVPVWVALPVANDWRWLQGREDSPWYPTLRLFRQRQRGNWQDVFARIAKELSKNACNPLAHSSIVGTNRP